MASRYVLRLVHPSSRSDATLQQLLAALALSLPSSRATLESVQVGATHTNLNLLHELPDFDQELAIQRTSSFELFPKLPMELRLAIWGLTWRGRTQYISWEHRTRSQILKSCLTIPTSGQVNRESREETLKHYELIDCFPFSIDWPDYGGTRLGRQMSTLPFFWNAAKDTFSIQCHEGAVQTSDDHEFEQQCFLSAVQRIRIPLERWYNENALYYERRLYEGPAIMGPAMYKLQEVKIVDAKARHFGGVSALTCDGIGAYGFERFKITMLAPRLEIDGISIVDGASGEVLLRYKDVGELREKSVDLCGHRDDLHEELVYLDEKACGPCVCDTIWKYMAGKERRI